MNNKEYPTDVKQRLSGSIFFPRSYISVAAMATVKFPNGGYFGFKVI